MSPLKSALTGLAVGLIAYFVIGNIGAINPSRGDSALALIGTEVSPSLSPSATEVTNRVTKSVTNLAPGAKTVSPSLAPSVTNLSPSPAISVTPRVSTLVAPTASPIVSVSPRPSVTPNPTPTSSPTPSPTPTITPLVTPTPTPPVGTSHVVINEIAWAGTATSSTDEWVELFNSGDARQELSGWFVCAGSDKVASFGPIHAIGAGQYFLMERTDESTIRDIAGDYVGPFSKSLVDSGLLLTLRSGSCSDGAVIDEVGSGPWYAGNGPEKASMERISSSAAGNYSENWATWGTGPVVFGTGEDAAGQPINGTPKYKNSVSL